MKILLIHDGNFERLPKVKDWKKNKSGLGEFYELSVILGENITKEDMKFLNSQIQKSIKLYGIQKVLFFQYSIKQIEILQDISRNIDFEFIVL